MVFGSKIDLEAVILDEVNADMVAQYGPSNFLADFDRKNYLVNMYGRPRMLRKINRAARKIEKFKCSGDNEKESNAAKRHWELVCYEANYVHHMMEMEKSGVRATQRAVKASN